MHLASAFSCILILLFTKRLSELLQMLTLGIGIGVLLMSLLLTYVMSSKADILFSSGREPTTTATY